MKNWKFAVTLTLSVALGACGTSTPVSPNIVDSGNFKVQTVQNETAMVTEDAVRAGLESVTGKQEIIRLKDVHGTDVEIPFAELEGAVAQVLRRKNRFFNDLFINGDGSVTLNAPRFLFSNTEHLFNLGLDGYFETEKGLGVCRHFGFSKLVFGRVVALGKSKESCTGSHYEYNRDCSYPQIPTSAYAEFPWLQNHSNFVNLNAEGHLIGQGAIPIFVNETLSSKRSYYSYATSITCVNRQ